MLDKKGITKLQKLLAKYIGKIIPLSAKDILPTDTPSGNYDFIKAHIYGNIMMCEVNRISQAHESHFKYKNLTDTDKSIINSLKQNIETIENLLIKPINEYLETLKSEATKKKESAIKGKVPENLLNKLQEIRDEWETIIKHNYEHYYKNLLPIVKDFLSNLPDWRLIDDSMRNSINHYLKIEIITYNPKFDSYTKGSKQYVLSSEESIEKTINWLSKNEADQWLFKMCDKLGGIKLSAGNIIIEKLDGKEPFVATLNIKLPNDFSFNMRNKIVINRSPLGNPYFQYPCTFESIKLSNGMTIKAMGEKELKEKINLCY